MTSKFEAVSVEILQNNAQVVFLDAINTHHFCLTDFRIEMTLELVVLLFEIVLCSEHPSEIFTTSEENLTVS